MGFWNRLFGSKPAPPTPPVSPPPTPPVSPPPPPPAPPPAPRFDLSSYRQKLRDANIMNRLSALDELEKHGNPFDFFGDQSALLGIRTAMVNDNIAVRIQAGFVLGRLTDTLGAEWVKPFSSDDKAAQDQAVRSFNVLSAYHAAAIPELVEVVLTDNHMAAVAYAVEGLCRIASKAAVVSVLAVEPARTSSDRYLLQALDSLNVAAVAGVLGLEAALDTRMPTARQDVQTALSMVAPFREQILGLGWALHPKSERDAQNPAPPDPEELARAVDGLKSDRADVRSALVLMLAMKGARAVAPHVRRVAEMLKDENAEVRKSTALALGSMGRFAALAVPALRAALQDKDNGVKQQVAKTLGAIGSPAGQVVAELGTHAENQFLDAEFRSAARDAIHRIGDTFQGEIPPPPSLVGPGDLVNPFGRRSDPFRF